MVLLHVHPNSPEETRCIAASPSPSALAPLLEPLRISTYSRTNQAKLNQQKVENAFFLLEQGIDLEYKNAATELNNSMPALESVRFS